ncbi:unnamed protein product, partial [Hapterophycus canaliculatus]
CAGRAHIDLPSRTSLVLCRRPLSLMMEGHRYAVKRLRFSPHPTGVLATASYDMSVVLWNTTVNQATNSAAAPAGGVEATASPARPPPRVLDRCVGHSEFVAGVAFSMLDPRVLATCAWDRRLCLWS